VLARLTLASNGCNRGNPAGDHSMSGKGWEHRNRHALTSQSKACMVNAKLREPQSRDLTKVMTQDGRRVIWHAFVQCCRMKETDHPYGTRVGQTQPCHPAPIGGIKARTGHLTMPHLLTRVNTGSPKRAALHSPAWRRSRHSSQMPGVTPGTTAGSRTVMAETDWATSRGTSASWVKGGALAEDYGFMTTPEGR